MSAQQPIVLDLTGDQDDDVVMEKPHVVDLTLDEPDPCLEETERECTELSVAQAKVPESSEYAEARWGLVYAGTEDGKGLHSAAVPTKKDPRPFLAAQLPPDPSQWCVLWDANLQVKVPVELEKTALQESMEYGEVPLDDIIRDCQIPLKLYPHQRFGLWFLLTRELEHQHGGFLADDMGLGKTVQTLALIRVAKQLPRAPGLVQGPTLIVCPLAVLENWRREAVELLGFRPDRVAMFYGAGTDTKAKYLAQKDIILTTYGTLTARYNAFNNTKGLPKAMRKNAFRERASSDPLFGLVSKIARVVCDESHYVKNGASGRHAALSYFCRQPQLTTWLLSGTPLNNGANDMAAQCSLVGVAPYDSKGFWQLASRSSDLRMQWRLQCLLRRSKTQVLARELNPKAFVVAEVLPTPQEGAIFKKLAAMALRFIGQWEDAKAMYDTREAGILRMRVLVAIQRMLMCTLHPLLLRGYFTSNPLASQKACRAQQGYLERPRKKTSSSKKSGNSVMEEDMEDMEVAVNRSCRSCGDRDVVLLPAACGHDLCFACCRAQCHRATSYHQKSLKAAGVATDVTLESMSHVPTRCNLCCYTQPWEPTSAQSLPRPSARIRAILDQARVRLPHTIHTNNQKNGSQGPKAVMFSKFNAYLDYVEVYLKNAGYDTLRYDGTLNERQRKAVTEAFKESSGPRILLVSITAGGAGLNLTSASQAWLLDHHYNPAVELQAIDRVHRLGQKEDVTVVTFHSPNTTDDWLCQLALKKRTLMDQVIDAVGDLQGSVSLGLSNEDIRQFGKFLEHWVGKTPASPKKLGIAGKRVQPIPTYASPLASSFQWDVVPYRFVANRDFQWRFPRCQYFQDSIRQQRQVKMQPSQNNANKRGNEETSDVSSSAKRQRV